MAQRSWLPPPAGWDELFKNHEIQLSCGRFFMVFPFLRVLRRFPMESPIGFLRGNWLASCQVFIFFPKKASEADKFASFTAVGASSTLPRCRPEQLGVAPWGRLGQTVKSVKNNEVLVAFLRMIVRIDLRVLFPFVRYPGKFCC